MITIAFFDVGETPVRTAGGTVQPLPGVGAALDAISRLETAAGEPLVLGIISDYHMPEPPATEKAIAALEQRYRDEVLDPSGLSDYFEPFDERVTLSSRAGATKPDRAIFEAALSRAGGTALSDCLFVTEDLPHLKKAKQYGLTPVRFGAAADGMPHFADWADAPAVIAELVAPGHDENRKAVAAAAAAGAGLVGFAADRADGAKVHGSANQLVALTDPRLGPLRGVHVELPTEATVEFGPHGRVRKVSAAQPDEDDVAEAVTFVTGLLRSQKVAIPGAAEPALGATHKVETDASGRRRLVRRRYSAV